MYESDSDESDSRDRPYTYNPGNLGNIYRTPDGGWQDHTGRRYQVFIADEDSERGRSSTANLTNLGHVHQTRGGLRDSTRRHYRVYEEGGGSVETRRESGRNHLSHRMHGRYSSQGLSSSSVSPSRSVFSNTDLDHSLHSSGERSRVPSLFGHRGRSSHYESRVGDLLRRSESRRSRSSSTDSSSTTSTTSSSGGRRTHSRLMSLLLGVVQAANTPERPGRGYRLAHGEQQYLPPNVEIIHSQNNPIFNTVPRETELLGVLNRLFPGGAPPNGSFAVVEYTSTGVEPRISLFDDHGAFELRGDNVLPVFGDVAANGGGHDLSDVMLSSLATLIDRTGVIPQSLRDNVHTGISIFNIMRRTLRTTSELNPYTPRASEGTISMLSIRPIVMNDLDADGKAVCSICLDEKQVGDEVTVLPCTHWFDKACVEEWLRQHGTCPVCRTRVEGTG